MWKGKRERERERERENLTSRTLNTTCLSSRFSEKFSKPKPREQISRLEIREEKNLISVPVLEIGNGKIMMFNEHPVFDLITTKSRQKYFT